MTSQSNKGDDSNIGDKSLKRGFGDVSKKLTEEHAQGSESSLLCGEEVSCWVASLGHASLETESVHL